MTSTHLSASALACALLASTALATPAFAQVTSPTFRQVDGNGVDLVHGDLVSSFTEGTIGSGESAISLMRKLGSAGSGVSQASQWDPILLTYAPGNGTYVDFGTRHDKFPGAESRGSTLSGGGGNYQYRASDGTVIAFANNEPENEAPSSNLCRSGSTTNCILLATSLTSPDGNVVTLDYDFWSKCVRLTPPGEPSSPDDPLDCTFTPRLSKITNSNGYAIKFNYAAGGSNLNQNPSAAWRQRTGAQFFNNVVNASLPQASVSYSYPSSGITDITDMGGRVWRLTANSTAVALRRPGATSNTTSYNLSSGKVTSATIEGVTTNYNRSISGSTITMAVTNSLSQQTVVTSDLAIGQPLSVRDALNRTTGYQYDGNGRLTHITKPEGDRVQFDYDTRGNITTTTAIAKPGSGLANIVTSASYDAACSNPKTCNLPNSTTDATGAVTNYAYDPTHGGPTSATLPAATVGGIRSQTRYSYSLLNGAYRLSGTSSCQTAASCTGTADEVKSSMSYDANGNVIAASIGDGTGALTATTTMGYDAIGNMLTSDGPLPGAIDVSRYRYNAARDIIGATDPDPDAGGTMKHRATRSTYTNGLLTKSERGVVASHSDADWAAFAPAEAVDTAYDNHARVKSQTLSSGGTAYALTQRSYDVVGRPECTAVRMNTAAFASLPASACDLGAPGNFGPDRIGKVTYDAAGQPVQQEVALGTTEAAVEAALTYTENGKVRTLRDGENNLTTYEYDGHDRLDKTRFPVLTKGANASSTTDYEQLTYNPTGTVATRRMRDGVMVGVGYDYLGRLISLGGSTVAGKAFAYDLLGRLTSATFAGGGSSFAATYDALGRRLTETGVHGTVNSEYDLAGSRKRMIYPGGGLFIDYDHLVTGEMTRVRENGATSGVGVLAIYGYDDLRRRRSILRGNGTVTSLNYDAVSRLASLTQDLNGNSFDQTSTFAHNPSSQIASMTRGNDVYAWTGHGAGAIASTINGLNQIAYQSGNPTGTFSYDLRGNLISDAINRSYGYDGENKLISSTAPGGGSTVTFGYDPLMRLDRLTGAATTRFGYDGLEMIAEYDGSGALAQRYVFGPGVDEPIVRYDASGERRWLHADERGSIVAASDSLGNLATINRYDEFGKPQIGNFGRFQFTGQMWLPEIGAYHYKARTYSATLGRFLQTDPIGYEGGVNLHTYVRNDPLNLADPTGLIDCGSQGVPVARSLNGPTERDRDAVYASYRYYCARLADPAGNDGGWGTGGVGGGDSNSDVEEVVVTGPPPQIVKVAYPYPGDSFCGGPTVGRANRFNPFGRINSGKVGGFGIALNDVGRIASANGIKPLGDVMVNSFTTGASILAAIPHGMGDGWYVSTNPISGYTSFSNSGLTFRYNAGSGLIRIDIPSGFNLPTGGSLAQAETCHYRR